MSFAIVINLGQIILGIMLALKGEKPGLHHCKKLLNEARFILGSLGGPHTGGAWSGCFC